MMTDVNHQGVIAVLMAPQKKRRPRKLDTKSQVDAGN